MGRVGFVEFDSKMNPLQREQRERRRNERGNEAISHCAMDVRNTPAGALRSFFGVPRWCLGPKIGNCQAGPGFGHAFALAYYTHRM